MIVCADIGFFWKRQDRPFDTDFVINLTTNAGTPCLVFATLLKVEMDAVAFRDMALASFLTFVAFAVAAGAILKAAGWWCRR